MTLQRILVTGGAGFIGSHTVDLLLAQDKQVVVLDNLSSGQLTNLNLLHPNLEFIEGDILEYPLVKDLIAGCDAVLHLAAIASVPLSIEDPIYTFQVNMQGFLHVLEAVRTTNREMRLVFASSAAVYGEAKTLPCREDMSTGTLLSPYALQKADNEAYANLYARLHGTHALGLRYFNVYGERQLPNSSYSGVISRFLAAYKKDEDLNIFGTGEQSRDFISVVDVARANVLALQSDYTGALNIATGQAETLLNMIRYIEEAGNRPAKVKFHPARAGDIHSSYAATQQADQHLGFKSSILLKDGVRLMV